MHKPLTYLSLILSFLAFSCSVKTPETFVESGVSSELAGMRTDQISNVNYLLYISLPDDPGEKIDASLVLEFFMSEVTQPVILDFHPDESYLLSVFHKGEALPYAYKNGHVIIDKKHFTAGQQQLEFHFTIPESALLAGENYLMTNPATGVDFLAFPAFNQEELPASFLLNMEIPAGYTALSNAAILKETQASGRKSVAFAKTAFIPGNQFSFIAGGLSKAAFNTVEGPAVFYYPENTAPDSIQLAQYAAGYQQIDTVSSFKASFSNKTDLVILPDLELLEMRYLPGLVYIGGE